MLVEDASAPSQCLSVPAIRIISHLSLFLSSEFTPHREGRLSNQLAASQRVTNCPKLRVAKRRLERSGREGQPPHRAAQAYRHATAENLTPGITSGRSPGVRPGCDVGGPGRSGRPRIPVGRAGSTSRLVGQTAHCGLFFNSAWPLFQSPASRRHPSPPSLAAKSCELIIRNHGFASRVAVKLGVSESTLHRVYPPGIVALLPVTHISL